MKLRGRYRDLSYNPYPYICIAFPTLSITHQNAIYLFYQGITQEKNHLRSQWPG